MSRTLRDKGHFTSEQAEALAEALGEAGHGDLATKADLAALKADLAEVRAELKADIAEVKVGRWRDWLSDCRDFGRARLARQDFCEIAKGLRRFGRRGASSSGGRPARGWRAQRAASFCPDA
jgi:hypothetical protein